MSAKITVSAKEYLLGKRHIDIVTGCWEWPGKTRPNGYVNFWWDGKSYLLHKFSYILWVGEVEDGLFVLHKCDNRKCYSPEHLFLGTDQENKDDMVSKGRQASGSRNGNSKINDHDVSVIFALYKLGFIQKEIGKMFNMSQAGISMILNRKRWS